jgi:hypothetical protein
VCEVSRIPLLSFSAFQLFSLQFRVTLVAMPVQKDTPKAIVIILLYLALLAGLLAAANHFRPHP